MFKVPGDKLHTDTPSTSDLIRVLGLGSYYQSVAFSKDQTRRLMNFYGFKDETNPLMEAGMHRNMFRHVERDGLRVMAFLSKYLEPGQDPVKLVAQLCMEAGHDVPNDYDWIYEDEE